MLKIYNTLSATKEEFKPIDPPKVGIYVCGPTVYDYDHAGHARTYVTFDLLIRFLHFLKFDVKLIENITDVGHLVGDAESGTDKIRQKAQETGETTGDIVRHYTEAHLKDMADLNILPATNFPKASEHIPDIIKFIQELIEKNYAYVTSDGNVYFSVARKSDYGKLSRRGIAEILTGTRVEPAKDKRSPADFALWKVAPFGAKEMVWESPWPVRGAQGKGMGFPGWHIECSVMSRKYLGDSFDIHGSAVEHVFPHHENEIAQTEALTGKEMAKYWVHTGMLTVNAQKMSKSLRNTILIQDALKDYSANEIRLAFFQTHYRKPFDYTKQAMDQGTALRSKLFLAYNEQPEKTDKEVFGQIIEALSDDLDTPRALSVWGENCRKISKVDTDKLFSIFGLIYRNISDDPKAFQLASERDAARTAKDFLTSDNRKAEIVQLGYEVIDREADTLYLPR